MPPGLDQRAAGFGGTLDGLPQVHPLLAQLHLATGDPGQVEQVVHQTAKLLHLPPHHLPGALDEGLVHAGLLEKLGGVPQRGQRVPEFVGQHRQELVLALVRLHQPLVEPLQLGVLAGQFPLGGQQFVVQAAQLVVDGNLRRRLPDLLRPPDPGQHPGGVGLPALPLPRLRDVQEASGHVQGLARIRGMAVCADPPPEFGVHVERVAAHHDLDALAGLRGPDLGDQLFDARQVEGHRDRDHEEVGPVLFDGLDDAPGGQVGPQVQRVPAVRLEEIGDDAQADLVQLAAHGRRRQPPPLLGQGEQVGVQLRHGELGRRRAVMLLGDRDLLQLPQPPDLPLAALEDLQVQVADGHARPHRIEDRGGWPRAARPAGGPGGTASPVR